jgi:hypothetical protein
VVVLLTLALVGRSARASTTGRDPRPALFSPTVGTAVAALCLTAAAAIVVYGLWLTVAK